MAFEQALDQTKKDIGYDGILTADERQNFQAILSEIPDDIPERLEVIIEGNKKLGTLTVFGQHHKPAVGRTSKITSKSSRVPKL